MPSAKLKKTSKKLKEDPYLVIKWYWTNYFKKYWPILVIGIFFMSLEGSMLGLLSYSIKAMFDKVFIPSNQSALISVGFISCFSASDFSVSSSLEVDFGVGKGPSCLTVR